MLIIYRADIEYIVRYNIDAEKRWQRYHGESRMKYEMISGREFNKALSRIRLVELQLIEFTDEAAPKGVECLHIVRA